MKNRIERILLLPKNQNDFKDQFQDCLAQIEKVKASGNKQIIQQSFFIKSSTNKEYLERLHAIYHDLEKIYSFIPSTSVIAQSPANGIYVSAELIILNDKSDDVSIEYKQEKGIHYTLIESSNCKELYAGGITAKAPHDKFIDQVKRTYNLLRAILDKELLSFSDIVRQWNYVEKILSIHDHNDEHIQNYQVLNDIRSQFYAPVEFQNGYPAATGIGMNSGGLVLEIYAIKAIAHVEIVPLKNPRQIDAYHYSETVLVGDALEKHHSKTTPKFERGKYISIGGESTIFISGTASIEKEKTIGEGDAGRQAEVTIANIAALISEHNLIQSQIVLDGAILKYTFIRVYIKNATDTDSIKNICNRYFDEIPVHYLIADVCRDNLLVEIEGIAEVRR
jgi:enamine deaminase RidA (YjgF/YER057c/UK114 family)